MPTAREALLEAAGAALAARPWPAIRMVEVAAAAGVSRQTLYNEFGGKEGLGRALLRREADAFLTGLEEALAPPGTPTARLAAAAGRAVRTARDRPLLRALLTGSRPAGLPGPDGTEGPVPPDPGRLLAEARDRVAARLAPTGVPPQACELALRIALSYVVAPPDGQWPEPDSWSPITPTITSVIETIFSVETRSPRNTIP
ncbi:TetR family transcriptional regulator [Streptomyces sp. NPDC012888]|uniref:TetR family transcriptional regulator n=1 Tax=Streptomyces sp. NPDC012888 TaxID=3364855 RepID=UPI003675E775